MLNAVLVFNNNGQPRLTKFYTQLVDSYPIIASFVCLLTRLKDTAVQQRLISEIFALVSARPPSSCNFLPLPPLLAVAAPSKTPSAEQNDAPSLVTYRHYATLYFIVISTSTESPLALLDLIQVFVEALDRLFENVCELDLIFNFETLHAVLGEMIVGGVVIETGLDKDAEGLANENIDLFACVTDQCPMICRLQPRRSSARHAVLQRQEKPVLRESAVTRMKLSRCHITAQRPPEVVVYQPRTSH
nr:ap-3 complex subunit sigma [Quercus suber]